MSLHALLAACSGEPSPTQTNGSPSGAVKFGLNANAAVPTDGYPKVFGAFTKKTGIQVVTNKLNYVQQINSYLTAAPDDLFIWNAGYRMRATAAQGLISSLDPVWEKVGGNFTEGVKEACTGDDGKIYMVPFYHYPWVTYYRPSVFKKHGYQVPKTLAELTALCDQMKADGLVPIAFADKEGWEAMGTFDIINMRTNGYDFHISLLKGKESWEDERVRATFEAWRGLLPYQQTGALGRGWQEAAAALGRGTAGMYFIGSFGVPGFGVNEADVDYFPFPEMNPEHGQDSIDAPIDGFMMVAKPDNAAADNALLEYLATSDAAELFIKTDKTSVATAQDVDPSVYTVLQTKYAKTINSTPHNAQYLDRDTLPSFATTVAIPSIQSFLRNSGSDINGLTTSMQQQAQTLFPQ